jgi:hypothetical protein
MFVAVLTSAFSDGDFGQVEILLTRLAAIFRAAGGNNYCFEILHMILNLKYVWTPDFACVCIFFLLNNGNIWFTGMLSEIIFS